MATPLEVLARVTELIKRFDNLRVTGTGWSGNSREGFLFDVDAGSGGGGTMFGGGVPVIPPPPVGPPHPPPIPPGQFGACCCAGACTQSTAGQCGGGCTFHPGGDCFLGNPCGAVAHSGACCFDETHCEVVPSDECTGTYLGDDTDCAGVDCHDHTNAGACCAEDGTCTIASAGSCTGIYLGDGSTCEGANCADRIACRNSGGLYCACAGPVCPTCIPTCCPAGTGCTTDPPYHCATCTDHVGGHCCCCCCGTAFFPACTSCGF